MKKRIAVKIVKDRVLPAVAPLIARGEGIGSTAACYSDRERLASRIFVRVTRPR